MPLSNPLQVVETAQARWANLPEYNDAIPGQSDQKSHRQASRHGADGPGVGDGVIDVLADIGAEDAIYLKNHLYQYLVRNSDRMVGKRAQQRAFGKEVGDYQTDAHL